MRRFNIFAAEPAYEQDDPEGYRNGAARIGAAIGAERLGATVYELPPGQGVCPYHYEHGDEEWAIVLAGRPTIRHPGGEDLLEPGDTVCFPAGPAGAHKVTNGSAEPARVLLLSTMNLPSVVVYPDSGKIGAYAPDGDDVILRRADAVDYYDGEI